MRRDDAAAATRIFSGLLAFSRRLFFTVVRGFRPPMASRDRPRGAAASPRVTATADTFCDASELRRAEGKHLCLLLHSEPYVSSRDTSRARRACNRLTSCSISAYQGPTAARCGRAEARQKVPDGSALADASTRVSTRAPPPEGPTIEQRPPQLASKSEVARRLAAPPRPRGRQPQGVVRDQVRAWTAAPSRPYVPRGLESGRGAAS